MSNPSTVTLNSDEKRALIMAQSSDLLREMVQVNKILIELAKEPNDMDVMASLRDMETRIETLTTKLNRMKAFAV